jgi:large subunit ribosomal protein L21
VRAGGRQYRIEPDQTLDVDHLSADVGSTVELNDVLLLAGHGDVRVGTPTLDGVRVIAEVVEHGRGKKILVYKQKSKTRYRRKRGHRQGYTRLSIRQIVTGAEEAEPEAPKRRAHPAPRAETPAEAPVETPAAEAEQPQPKPRTRRARPAAGTKSAAEPAVEPPVAEGADSTPAAEAKPARRTRARKAPEEKQPAAPNDADKKADGE